MAGLRRRHHENDHPPAQTERWRGLSKLVFIRLYASASTAGAGSMEVTADTTRYADDAITLSGDPFPVYDEQVETIERLATVIPDPNLQSYWACWSRASRCCTATACHEATFQ